MTDAQVRVLLSMAQAQEMLGGIGKTVMYDLIAAGEVQRVKIGRRAFITLASLNDYLDRLIQGEA